MSEMERRSLKWLNELVAAGWEFPEAMDEVLAASDLTYDELKELYDNY